VVKRSKSFAEPLKWNYSVGEMRAPSQPRLKGPTMLYMRGSSLAAGWALIALATAGCDSSSPMSPTDNAAAITIVANNGAQSFAPNPAPVGGQMAVWTNGDGEAHRIVANDGSFDTGNISPEATSIAVALPAEGINYHCSIHPTMIGAIGGSGGNAPPACVGPYC